MIWLWIVGIFAALLLLLCLLRLGVLVAFDETAAVWVSVGPVRIQILPSKPGKKKPEKQKAQKKRKEEPAEKNLMETLKKIPRPTLEDLRSAFDTLWPPMKKALGRTRRGIRVDPLELSVTLGGKDDPAAVAERYGYAHAAVWTAMPALEQLLTIPNPAIHMGLDFDADGIRAKGRVGLSIPIGTLLAVGLQMGVPTVKWLWRYWKKHKKAAEKEAAPPVVEPAEHPAA